MKGTIADTPAPEVFRDLHFDRADGVLRVRGGGRGTEIFFDRGTIFYCKVDSPEARLDRILVKWGLVRPDAVDGLIQRAGQDVRGTLVREGVFADEKSFDDFMAQVLRERIMDVFVLGAAEYEFTAEDVRSLHRLPFPTSTPDIVLEGVRRQPDPESLLAPLVADRSALLLNERPSVPLQGLHMSPAEGYVLSQVTGTASVADIASVSPLGRDQTIRLLYGLLVLDIVRHPSSGGYRFAIRNLAHRVASDRDRETRERELISTEYERVRSVDVFGIVPGGESLAPAVLRERLHDYQEKWRPERFSDRVAREMRDHLLLIAGRAAEALLAGMDASHWHRTAQPAEAVEGDDEAFHLKRMEFSRTETQEKLQADSAQAQEHFRRAQEAVRAKDYHRAVQFAEEAIRLNETAEYHALLAEALSQNPRWRRRAESAYLRAIELDQFDERLRVALGRLYARGGLRERARAQYERALEIQKDSAEAKQALRELKG